MIERVVSGGQTGVGRAALDAAISAGIACGGWCPRGRRAEDGSIPAHYPLKETPGATYIERTRRNIEDSDGTLVLTRGVPSGGTAATIDHARRTGRPLLVIDLATNIADDEAGRAGARVAAWIESHRIRVMNVAGPRESGAAGIYEDALGVMRRVLEIAATRRQA